MLTAAVVMASGCKSKTESAAALNEATVVEEVESARWKNLYAPVAMEIMQPVQFSTSGRGQMVRGESIWLSMRMLGMEVASAYATPAEAVMAVKMPRKMKMSVPLVELLQRGGMTFEQVQEALLGNEEALAKLPEGVSYRVDTNERKSTVELYATYAGKPLSVRLTWTLSSAEWDVAKPRTVSLPGSDYSTVTLQQALSLLKN